MLNNSVIKACSFKHFIEILTNERCKVVNAEVVRIRKRFRKGWLKWIASPVDIFEYSIEFSSRTSTGKEVIYRKPFLTKQEERPWSPDVCDITMQLLQIADQKLREIKKKVPSIATSLLVDQEGPLFGKRYESFRNCAKRTAPKEIK